MKTLVVISVRHASYAHHKKTMKCGPKRRMHDSSCIVEHLSHSYSIILRKLFHQSTTAVPFKMCQVLDQNTPPSAENYSGKPVVHYLLVKPQCLFITKINNNYN